MRKRGFTLIELLMVIMVIAILIGIALPRFKGMQEAGNIAKAKGELRTLQIAVESHYMHYNNTYPANASNWETALASDSPQILSSAMNDTFKSGSQYGYAMDTGNGSTAKYYVIYSVGAAGDGSASVLTNGTITETDAPSCIYVSNAGQDTQP